MEQGKELVGRLRERLAKVAASNAVVAGPITVGDRHIVTLSELGLTFGGGSGRGEGGAGGGPGGAGGGAGAAGGAKASPIAVVVIEDGRARLEKIGR